MNFGQIVPGRQNKWTLLNKLGEGDAGEVYLVESLLEGKQAILKRPRKSTFSSDILRQSAQIKTEGRILKSLQGVPFPERGTHFSTPALLDQSQSDDGLGESYFIVIERAPGFDLKSLVRLAHFGQIETANFLEGEEYEYFIQQMRGLREIPAPLLVRSLLSVIYLLETIHNAEIWDEGAKQRGAIWNDVKPEHLYWDPLHAHLTVIDWGNGAFLEADGATKDRRASSIDDYYQFVQAMGEFLSESSPDLFNQLDWPQDITPGNAYTDGVKPLKEKLAAMQEESLARLRDLRNAASSLYGMSRPAEDHLTQSDEIQYKITALGEIPDFPGAVNFHTRVALHLVSENNLEAFQKICKRTSALATSSSGKWDLLGEIAGIALEQNTPSGASSLESFSSALAAGIADDWRSSLWELFEWVGKNPEPGWWETVSQGVRRVHLQMDEEALTPYIVVSRLFFTLRAALSEMANKNVSPNPEASQAFAEQMLAHENLLNIFNEEVLKKWKEIEPAPPDSGIAYQDVEGFLEDIEVILPGSQEKLDNVLAQPKAYAEIVLNAWERKDFEKARQALRMVLLWDPDRRRLLQADRAIGRASQWLANVRNGAGTDEPFYDYLTSVELAGRNLRNRVGSAKWLDLILDSFKQLRKGIRPADLIMEHPELMDEIPWLNEHRSREILSLPRTHSLSLERDEGQSQPRTVSGTTEGRLGLDQDLILAEPLDTWVAEARGSSARVFAGYLRDRANKPQPYAIKIMRPNRMDYALPLFREEAHILSLLRDIRGVSPMVECGFLLIDEGMELPGDEGQASGVNLSGSMIRFGVEEVQNFLASMDRQLAQGWLPYLALVKRNQEQNLMKYCDAGYNHGWFLPLRESLLLSIQICDILQCAHDRNIVYRDHKILHFYWDPETHGVVMIDWNIAKRQAQGLSEAEKQFDLSQFGARALHHILTGRPAQGALPLGPNRPEEIERASLSYPVNWTYDDERLPKQVKDILEGVLNQGYSQMRDLRADLLEVYQQIPDPVQDGNNS